jgi:hypothetical protein
MKIRILFDLNENIQGKAQHFDEGDEVEVPDADATRMIEGLQAEPAVINIAAIKRRRKDADKEAESWLDEQ